MCDKSSFSACLIFLALFLLVFFSSKFKDNTFCLVMKTHKAPLLDHAMINLH